MAGAAGTADAAGTAEGHAAAGARRGSDDDAMTRSGERMHVGVERREAGRARLRKYVVTEEEERPVGIRPREPRVPADNDRRHPAPEARRRTR
ncbi:DUF2382 domain-containing protein [Streptomyces sp. NPDC049915]|uniref:DUF2382 domain-containing protein n=1 Tax=Streptomyces sp. NPDC049915 TaxID=3155510 RepID=UPI003423AD88